jgi:xylulokinase
MARLLGIDIGTTGVRAAVFEPDGTLLADASAPCPFDAPESGWAEIPAERWWSSIEGVLDALAASYPSFADVTAIGVVGQAPTAVLVGDDRTAIDSAVLWLDTRASTEASELGVHAYYLGPKLLWLSRHGSLARARWVLQSHAFIAYRLTGEVAIDPSTAALCLPLFDLASRSWVPEACARVGVRPDQLPPVRAAHEVIGHVTKEAAAAIGHGLRAGTPVVAGGGDFAAATLGAGVIEEGEACLMLGTAGNLLVPRRTPGRDRALINAHHVGADRWLSLGGTLSGGAQEWLRYALTRATGTGDTAIRTALPAFELLDAEAEVLPAGSEGLLFLPYLQGERTPIWDVYARGAYVGLGLQHARGHLWRALLEGIALGFVDCQEVLERDGVRLREIVAANGGGKSALFRQILCDALGVPLTYAPGASGTVAGAAILAGLGTGALASASDARSWRDASVRHEPDARNHERYRALLELRRQAYTGLKPVFFGLAAHS